MWRRVRDALAVVTVVGLAIIAAGCSGAAGRGRSADGGLAGGPFSKLDRLGTELRRGSSSKADVERVLGLPTGRGTTLLPTQSAPREVWVYQLVQKGDVKSEGVDARAVPIIRIDLRQHFLMVFFEADRFDGYLWSSWVQPAKAVAR